MSQFIRILCRSRASLSRWKIVEFINDGVFFEEPIEFVPPDQVELQRSEWSELRLIYSHSRRPIIFHRNYEDDLVSTEVAELEEVLRSSGPDSRKIRDHLRDVVQTIAIEFAPEGLPEDVWRMLDAIESYIASELDGMIYVPGEGFYDKGLKK